jgi:membrane-bound lytic murein transglycosylase D
MMKKEFLPLIAACIIAHPLQAEPAFDDTTRIYLADSLNANLEVLDSIESNFDSNLDSMLNLYYIQEVLPDTFFVESEIDSIPDFPDSVYIARLATIPTIIDLSYNRIVKNYIDSYVKKRRKSVEVMLGLSEHYFPIFDEIFDYYDIPNELKYMSIIESALNPRAYSRARAVGLWQFMYGTGRMYGLEINSLVDERLDPIKSTCAAAQYSRDLYNIYNDWILVIAAYNCGPGNVNRAIRRTGGKTNYWDIYYYLPRETRGHVPAFIAATYLMNYYTEHNLVPAKVDIPIATDTLLIKEPLHLSQVAEVLNIPLKQLQDLNPQYRYNIIPAGQKTYSLCLPNQYTLSFIDNEDSIFTYKDSVFFDASKLTVSPATHNRTVYIPEAPGSDYVKLIYTVKSGDNLGYISEWYNVKISDLRYWNNIRHNLIRSGQKLVIYKHKSKADKYRRIDSMTFAQKQAMIGKPTTVPTSEQNQTSVSDNTQYIMYTVKSGDTLWDIAKMFPGVTDTDIMRLNNITDASKIRPGQQLKIKPKS